MAKVPPFDITNYEKPTEEEVGLVLDYWTQVQDLVNTGGRGPQPRPTPTQTLIQRVAVHQRWQKAMLCTHPSVVISGSDPLMCGECDRPLRFLSDLQIEDIKRA
jgi:hypothetical protein